MAGAAYDGYPLLCVPGGVRRYIRNGGSKGTGSVWPDPGYDKRTWGNLSAGGGRRHFPVLQPRAQPRLLFPVFLEQMGVTYLEYVDTIRLEHIYVDLVNTEAAGTARLL